MKPFRVTAVSFLLGFSLFLPPAQAADPTLAPREKKVLDEYLKEIRELKTPSAKLDRISRLLRRYVYDPSRATQFPYDAEGAAYLLRELVALDLSSSARVAISEAYLGSTPQMKELAGRAVAARIAFDDAITLLDESISPSKENLARVKAFLDLRRLDGSPGGTAQKLYREIVFSLLLFRLSQLEQVPNFRLSEFSPSPVILDLLLKASPKQFEPRVLEGILYGSLSWIAIKNAERREDILRRLTELRRVYSEPETLRALSGFFREGFGYKHRPVVRTRQEHFGDMIERRANTPPQEHPAVRAAVLRHLTVPEIPDLPGHLNPYDVFAIQTLIRTIMNRFTFELDCQTLLALFN